MLAQEWSNRASYRGSVKILATDISLTALETGVAGTYSSERVRLVPQDLKRKYLENSGDDLWTVSPVLRSLIFFRRLNFMDPIFPFRNLFHGVFCRNVMIYFDRDTKDALVEKICRHLAPGRYFFIGHSESLGRSTSGLEYVQPSVYRRLTP
jgi:chemotaxis protein methyltransferase CheR